MLVRYHRHRNKEKAARANEMMTFQPTPRQHDPVNSTNTTPKRTTPYQNDKARGEKEEHSKLYMEKYRSASQRIRKQQPNNTQRPNNNHQETITITMVQKSTRLLTSDDSTHELIQELSELKDRHWYTGDLAKAIRRTVHDETRTHLRRKREQESTPRSGNVHPQEMDQTHQGSEAFRNETHRSFHRDEEVQTTSLLKTSYKQDTETNTCNMSTLSFRSTLTGAGGRTRTFRVAET